MDIKNKILRALNRPPFDQTSFLVGVIIGICMACFIVIQVKTGVAFMKTLEVGQLVSPVAYITMWVKTVREIVAFIGLWELIEISWKYWIP